MDSEIDLRDVLSVLWRRRRLIAGIFLAFVVVAGVIALAMAPVYRVSSIIAVGNFGDPIYTSPVSARSIMLSDEFLLEVLEGIRPADPRGFADFKESVRVVSIKDSDRLIEISIETTRREEGLKAVEMMVSLFANRSLDSYDINKRILTGQLAEVQESIKSKDMEIDLAYEALEGIRNSSGSSDVQSEMRFSRTLDRLGDMETQRYALMDRSLDLQKQLELLKHLEVVQPAKEPVSPIRPRKVLILAIGGMLGLLAGLLGAFLWESLGGRTGSVCNERSMRKPR